MKISRRAFTAGIVTRAASVLAQQSQPPSARPKLRIWLGPPSLDIQQLQSDARVIETFLADSGYSWEDDCPPEAPLLFWNGTQWRLQREQSIQDLGRNLSLDSLRASIGARVRFRPSLPLDPRSEDLIANISGAERDSPFRAWVERISSPELADYRLDGRRSDYELQYAWTRAMDGDADESNWTTFPQTEFFREAARDLQGQLFSIVQRAILFGFSPAKDAGWHLRLLMKNPVSGDLAKGSYTEGETYEVLAEISPPALPASPSGVYLIGFALDASGGLVNLGDRDIGRVGSPGAFTLNRIEIVPPPGTDRYVILAYNRAPGIFEFTDLNDRQTLQTFADDWDSLLGACVAEFVSSLKTPALSGTAELTREARARFRSYKNLVMTRGISNAVLPARVFTVEEIVKSVPKFSGLLIYGLQDGSLCSWLLSSDGIIAFHSRPASRRTIEQTVGDFHAGLGLSREQRLRSPRTRGVVVRPSVAYASGERSADDLTELLFPADIARALSRIQRLIVLPSGSISTVPFALLNAGGGGRLVERLALSIAPSLEFLATGAVTPFDGDVGKPLIAGNPHPPKDARWEFSRLPGAGREATLIARSLGTEALIGMSASRADVVRRAQTADFLYFATHAVADPEDPLDGSFLVLSAGADGDWRWTARQIQSNRLAAKMAVLSACQTGLGRAQDAGIIGVARAFQKAGVPRVVMSLWSVNDEATAELMTGFMHQLKSKPPSEALRRAMLETRKQFPDARNWASFSLFGTD